MELAEDNRIYFRHSFFYSAYFLVKNILITSTGIAERSCNMEHLSQLGSLTKKLKEGTTIEVSTNWTGRKIYVSQVDHNSTLRLLTKPVI